MIEIRWHGRGGQGAVTAAEILARAAISEGKFAQALPAFGPERTGAPVLAFNRIDDKPIPLRTEVKSPDVVVVLDPRLPRYVNVTAGLKPNPVIVMNTKKSPDEIKEILKLDSGKLSLINATDIAFEILKRPIVNTAMLGALIRAYPLTKLESVIEAIKEVFPGKIGELNEQIIRRTYEEAKIISV